MEKPHAPRFSSVKRPSIHVLMPYAPCPMPGALCDRFSLSFSHLLYSIFPSLLFFPHFSLFLFLEFLRLTWDDHNISQTPPFLTSFLFLLFLPIYQCMSIASSSSFEVCLLSTDISSSSSFFFFSVKKKKNDLVGMRFCYVPSTHEYCMQARVGLIPLAPKCNASHEPP